MESAPVARPIASAAYSFVRFCGGAIAPFVAGKLGEHVSVQAPFYLGAAMTVLAIGVLYAYRTAFVPVHHEDPVLGAELDTELPAPVAA
jgi:MFS transporter, ACDE family, multidrug resistance protein